MAGMKLFEPPPKRQAFVLGIADYDHSVPLKNTIADARDIAKQLRGLNFEVFDFYDLDFNNLLHHMTAFLKVEPGEEKLDAILIYYAGHGIQLGDKNYIVPKDFDPHSSYPLVQLVSVQMLLERMDAKADKKLLFLDACRDAGGLTVTNAVLMGSALDSKIDVAPKVRDELNLVDEPATTRSLSGSKGLAKPSLGRLNQTFIAFAADPGEKALDGPKDGNSPFTTGVLKYIDQRAYDVFDMCQCVARDVRKETNLRQVPWTNSNLIDQFEFHRADGRPVIELTLMGLIAGMLTAIINFDLFDFGANGLTFGSGQLAHVKSEYIYLVTSLFLGTALGIGAYRYAKPLHSWGVLLTTCAIYTVFAICSRLVLAPIADLEAKTRALRKLDMGTFQQVFGEANIDEPGVVLLIAILFFAIVAGALVGAGSVLASAAYHPEMRRVARIGRGALIGMSAPVALFLFLFVRLKYVGSQELVSDRSAHYLEVFGIILLVAAWQGALAWNVGRGYDRPRYRDT